MAEDGTILEGLSMSEAADWLPPIPCKANALADPGGLLVCPGAATAL